MMARVTDEDFGTAILWLQSNNGPGGEQSACHRVAEFLENQLRQRRIRKIATHHKITYQEAGYVLSRLEPENP